ncbi:MAG: hypothetical protein QNI96_05175 [Woeseiaceae bacterium]|nr:hypothetical protein [Woeseiaceae bacterium]
MRYKVNPYGSLGLWRTALTWRNKEWTKNLIRLIVDQGLEPRRSVHGFTVYELCDLYRNRHGEYPVETTVRQILRKLERDKLIINIKE